MGEFTIGEFARASRLSAKALRLYDSLGLLTPARVDESSGYRYYDPAQLGRAQLVAWLRRLGMPLARIKLVCDLDPGEAAAEIAVYWTNAEAEHRAGRDLAAFLVGYLSGASARPAVAIRYAVRSDIGRVRDRNQDAAFASEQLLAVADGFGPSGERASAAAINALLPVAGLPVAGLPVTGDGVPALDLLNTLQDAVAGCAAIPGSGTTLTAMVVSGSSLALVHIGDSRAYLLRGGELFQITHDHTVTQALLDQGKITASEAESLPRPALLLRAIGERPVTPDVSLHEARPGDRYLLASDGLTSVVPRAAIHTILTGPNDPEQAVARLTDLANEAGGPDNIGCVVADVLRDEGDPAAGGAGG